MKNNTIKINGKVGGIWIDVKNINVSRGSLVISDGDNTIWIPKTLTSVIKRKLNNKMDS